MSDTYNQACPLCSEQAAFELFDSGKRKRFLCDGCGRFIITVGAEKRLSKAIPSWREEMKSKVSATPEGNIIEIRLSPVAGRQPERGYSPLDTEYIPR